MAFDKGNIPKETLDYLASKNAERKTLSSAFLLLLIVACIIFALFAFFRGDSHKITGARAVATATKSPVDNSLYLPKEVITQAKKYMAAKDYQGVLMEIDFLRPEDRSRHEVQAMYAKASNEKARNERKAYASDYERQLLAAGADATVRVGNIDDSALTITFVLINRPFVYQIQNDSDLNSQWRHLGFKTVHLTDGYDSSWSYKLD